MTPMIGFVFQLLFFLVASHFEEQARVSGEERSMRNLPEAAAAMPMTMRPRQNWWSTSAATVSFYVGGNLLGERQLADQLRRTQTDNPGNQSVVIRGDERRTGNSWLASRNMLCQAQTSVTVWPWCRKMN